MNDNGMPPFWLFWVLSRNQKPSRSSPRHWRGFLASGTVLLVWGIYAGPAGYGLAFCGAVLFGIGLLLMPRPHLIPRSLAQTDMMDGKDFEDFVGRLLAQQGWDVELCGGSYDHGCDIIATQGDRRMAVQVKRARQRVGRNAVSDVVTGAQYQGCSEKMVVTNSVFTDEAREVAEANDVELIDRQRLADWIEGGRRHEL